MCDDNCGNLKPERIRCEPCRTINLAQHAKMNKPNMQVYSKCTPATTCMRVQECSVEHLNPWWWWRNFLDSEYHGSTTDSLEMPIHPICIRVCDKEEYNLRRGATKIVVPKVPVGHGKIMYAVKAAVLLGAVYVTYKERIWGEQYEVTEAIRRWQEYIRSINTRRPPTYDACGKVTHKESSDSVIAPMYALYKNAVTTCFSGIVKLPVIAKCMYIDYLKAMERRHAELVKERKVKRNA